ncbi:hypothetical protein HanHA89_Chr11g0413181 [Helianthus annuus]|nr:hypothetical protein HanHA89_Chr11g0413181 [Helianthus annuus]
MYEHSTRSFNFLESILAMGGLSSFYLTRPKTFYEGRGCSESEDRWHSRRGAPNVEGSNIRLVLEDGTPSLEGVSPKGLEGSQKSPPVVNVRSNDEDLETHLSRKSKPDPTVGTSDAFPKTRNNRLRLRSTNKLKSQPVSQTMSKPPPPPVNTKGSLSKHLKVLQPSSGLVSGPLPVRCLRYLGSSKVPITIPATPARSQAKGKGPEISATPIEPVIPTSRTQAAGQSVLQRVQFLKDENEGLVSELKAS